MFKLRSGLLTAAVIVAALAPALAQRSPSASTEMAPSAGAARIQTPANGDAVTSPFKVQIGPSPTPGVAPTTVDKATTGRHVLLIDTTLGDQNPTQSIKADAQHVLFRKGQIAAMVTLPVGKHTLQFVLVDANDIPSKPPVQSETITITVRDSGATATANTGSREAADAKAAQETQKAAETRQAAEAKRALEAKEALEAKQAREASQAEQALAAKEAREVIEALEARKALEAKQALEARLALEAKQALESRLAKEEEQSRLALAKQAREAQQANEARQDREAKRAKAAQKTTAHLRVKHAKARKTRSAMAHLKRVQMPLLLHPELWEIQRPHRLHQRHHQHRAHADAHGHRHAHGYARQHHHGQLHHQERHRHHCHRGPHHHPNRVSNK